MALGRLKNSKFYKKHKFRLERANACLSFASALCLILFLMGDQSATALKNQQLANEIRSSAIVSGIYSGVFAVDNRIIKAMARVPRHRYIDAYYNDMAYHNVAIPLYGQEHMIAEPFLTAMMIELMAIDKNDKVLEIGFGSGYDAAVISKLAEKVYSVRQIDPLNPATAAQIAPNNAYENVFKSDSSAGMLDWPDAGPYDAILIRQSMYAPPDALLKQLNPGGRLVVPIGPANGEQRLMVYISDGKDIILEKQTLYIRVSPLLKGTEI